MLFGSILCAGVGCNTTVDALGYNDSSGIVLHRLSGPASYPNAFRDVLGESDADIAAKIAGAFMQLFHGDPNLQQPIYFQVSGSPDQAYIEDVYHGDIRTEGIGYGMIIAVELDEQDEFDHLWTYAKDVLEQPTGPSQGYFNSSCGNGGGTDMACLDPFGLQQFLMALLFANDRWGSVDGGIDYGHDAKELLTVMRHKQDENGGIVDGVTDTFDATKKLVFQLPDVSEANESGPSMEMPAYYDLWAQATRDPFWTQAAAAGRAYWKLAANATTGLMPVRARFDGTPSPGWDTFATEGYRAQANMVLDQIWSGTFPWDASEADQLLRFFIGQGIDQYGGGYSLDGTMILDPNRENSLIVTNGMTALIATVDQRAAFIEAVWNLPVPTGSARYYTGILYLQSLLVLGGQFRVY